MLRFVPAFLFALFFCKAPAQFMICEPVGGMPVMTRFISEELIYPEHALEQGIEGEVWLIFTVMADGTVKDLRVWKGLEPSCDAEALRLGSLILWRPALLNERPVDAEHSMVVTYSPKLYRKWLRSRNPPDPILAKYPAATDNTVHLSTRMRTPPGPVIPKGEASIEQWWQKQLRYPTEALRHNLQGTVRVRFIVEASGNLSNMHAITELGGGCVAEAFRMLRTIAWRPAIVNDQRVRSQIETEIHFKLP